MAARALPRRIVIATRESALALWQARHIETRLRALYPDLEIEIRGMTTEGDRRLGVSLAKVGGKGLFVKELEEALARLEHEYAERFVRVHRNCLIARKAVRGFERGSGETEGQWVALLEGCDEKIPVSRRQQHIVRELART